ncbi:hypothetical protein K440DRAFT_673980 [Wilcoxina mikolae CBS 423.85]|nr:hypothetical protein K440DRAFT_673980 [Wilcoxina mikolae CBS 423.85]
MNLLRLLPLGSLLFAAHAYAKSYPNPNSPLNKAHTICPDYIAIAHQKALDHGVDPMGPMPNDYIEDNGQFISYDGDSQFALWASAQRKPLLKRDVNDLPRGPVDLVYWTGTTCGIGKAKYFYNLHFMGWYGSDQESQSMEIKGGPIDPDVVRLWLRGPTCDDDLKEYVYGYNSGCVNDLPSFTCVNYRLQPDELKTSTGIPSPSST